MQLAMIARHGRTGLALRMEGGLAVCWEDRPDFPGRLDRLVADGAGLMQVGAFLRGCEIVPVEDVHFLLPLPNPGKILCVGLNYRDHASESKIAPPSFPEIFLRVATSLVAHGEPIASSPLSAQLDYEAEMVAVIGRTAKAVAREDALDHVVGYSIFNDGSFRDLQLRTMQWTVGKNCDRSGAFGPWIVPSEALPRGGAGLRISTRLNGQTVQDANTDDLLFDVATLVSDLSQGMTLLPGDMILTGTPGGVGMARQPQLWMKPGDLVEVTVERIGTLSNAIK